MGRRQATWFHRPAQSRPAPAFLALGPAFPGGPQSSSPCTLAFPFRLCVFLDKTCSFSGPWFLHLQHKGMGWYPEDPGVLVSLEEASRTDQGTATLENTHQEGWDCELTCFREKLKEVR